MYTKFLHTPEGVRDIYGKEYAKKLSIEEKLREKIVAYGYKDIQTPTFEYFEVFSKEIGTTPSKELYKFFDKEGNTLVLRPDFTPSIARCAAKYFMEESVPIRFSYMGNTFTNTSNLQGKLKEVTQMGAELINDGDVEADGEIIALVSDALQNTGLTNYQISIGNVEYFKGLCEEAGLEEETELALREYISAKNYFAAEDLLTSRNVNGSLKESLLKSADLFGNIEVLKEAKSLIHNERSLNAVLRLERLYEVLQVYGMESHVSFDLGLLSKYHYYTGIIFKAYTYGMGDAIVKGGRYDTLLNQFGKQAPAIGFVIVVDDLLEALSRQKIDISVPVESRILTYTQETYPEVIKEAISLRNAGISVTVSAKEKQEKQYE